MLYFISHTLHIVVSNNILVNEVWRSENIKKKISISSIKLLILLQIWRKYSMERQTCDIINPFFKNLIFQLMVE